MKTLSGLATNEDVIRKIKFQALTARPRQAGFKLVETGCSELLQDYLSFVYLTVDLHVCKVFQYILRACMLHTYIHMLDLGVSSWHAFFVQIKNLTALQSHCIIEPHTRFDP